VQEDRAVFLLHDPDGAFAWLRLRQELQRPRQGPELVRREGAAVWELDFPRPAVDRMEYAFEGRHHDGRVETFCDPGNPLRAPGAFGDRSVVEFPGYRAPAWCDDEPLGGQLLEVAVPSSRLRTDLSAKIWTSRDADPEAPLPLLVAHDGSEYAHLSQLLRLLDRMTQAGRLPPLRAVLLDPVDRNEHYSASAAYAQAVAGEVLPALAWLAPNGRHPVVGMGASLGALAMLHVHRSRPSAFAGLFLQSSSFFRQRYDRQESGFPRFRRIARFVGEVLNASSAERAIPVTLTCGAVEENLANNRAVTRALRRQGYEARLHVSRDAHNYIAWRDTFDPNLVDLLARVWR
jgi:enterochelin esterase family protein